MPFTAEEFLGFFTRYNLAVWPAQPLLLALALTAVFLATLRPRGNGEGVFLILAALWLWGGAVFHMGYFRTLTPAAWGLGVLFLVQGVAFGVKAFHDPGSFQARRDLQGFLGGAVLVYALLVYPIVGSMAGHAYPEGPSFGAPCPTTIFTLGILLWFERRIPLALLLVPGLCAVVGTWVAMSLGVTEDFGLPLAAVAALGPLIAQGRWGSEGPEEDTEEAGTLAMR